jgi:hypothetical protein
MDRQVSAVLDVRQQALPPSAELQPQVSPEPPLVFLIFQALV